MSKIKVKLQCTNIAPLTNLNNEFENNSLKIGVFANNGSGKTFISRMFRLLEKSSAESKDGGAQPVNTNRLITLGKNNASFEFKISDEQGTTMEDVKISLTKTQAPNIPTTQYIYHTFNQDYVEDNIRALGYEHKEDVQGFILGKTNIDITDDEKKVESLEKDRKELGGKIETKINAYIEKNISSIANIRRLNDYGLYVSAEAFLTHGEDWKQDLPKTINDYIKDYDKIKAVPENLTDIVEVPVIQYDKSVCVDILTTLSTTYSLSKFAEEFKSEMRAKQGFVEKGLELLKDGNGKCPFCNQFLDEDALKLIDQYNEFVFNEESKTIKLIQNQIKDIGAIRKDLSSVKAKNSDSTNRYNEYKTKYIPSCENKTLELIDTNAVDELLESLLKALEKKQIDISKKVQTQDRIDKAIEQQIEALNKIINGNNVLIEEINSKKNAVGEESKEIRRNICKATYNYWIEKYGAEQKKYVEFGRQIEALKSDIKKKQESVKVSKKKLVATTIKQVLNYFFSGKYSLDESTFRLVFQSKTLEKDQTKNVLSEGEKNIVAFAYYLGDTHTLIEKEDDYKRLFFIIDDPISSMDFTYVYTLSGVVRDFKLLFDKAGDRIRHIILTHNSDFIRILDSNNILDKVLLLKDGELHEWNDNFTVPYINHLLDVYRIARKNEKATHTTANSIRHIIETIDKFERINSNGDSVKEFIRNNIPNNKKSYTFINDLSHGGWRTEQQPMTDDDYHEVCEAIVVLIDKRYPNQIKYCEEFTKK